jgi:MFS family permease
VLPADPPPAGGPRHPVLVLAALELIVALPLGLAALRSDPGFADVRLRSFVKDWFFLGYPVALGGAAVFVGYLVDRYGRRRLLRAGLALHAGGLVTVAATTVDGVLLAGVLVAGVGAACLQVVVLVGVAERARPDRIDPAAVVVAGLLIAATFGAWLPVGALAEGIGWRWAALAPVPVALALWRPAAGFPGPPVLADPRTAVDHSDRVWRSMSGDVGVWMWLVTLGLTALLVAGHQAALERWSGFPSWLAIGGLILLAPPFEARIRPPGFALLGTRVVGLAALAVGAVAATAVAGFQAGIMPWTRDVPTEPVWPVVGALVGAAVAATVSRPPRTVAAVGGVGVLVALGVVLVSGPAGAVVMGAGIGLMLTGLLGAVPAPRAGLAGAQGGWLVAAWEVGGVAVLSVFAAGQAASWPYELVTAAVCVAGAALAATATVLLPAVPPDPADAAG